MPISVFDGLLVTILGLCIGSFLNVVVYRLPIMLKTQWQAWCREELGQPTEETATFNLNTPASHCPQCKKPVRWYENIPLLSYLMLRGRCNNCQTHISWRYPFVELVTGLLALAVYCKFGLNAPLTLVNTLPVYAFVITLWCLALIDWDTQLLPDNITLPLLWSGLLYHAVLSQNAIPISLADAVTGAAAGYLVLWSIYQGFKLLTGKEGMGYGDFKLLAALGAWLGWQALPEIILISCLLACVFAAIISLINKAKLNKLAFGPYLAAAAVISLFYGPTLRENYWALVSM